MGNFNSCPVCPEGFTEAYNGRWFGTYPHVSTTSNAEAPTSGSSPDSSPIVLSNPLESTPSGVSSSVAAVSNEEQQAACPASGSIDTESQVKLEAADAQPALDDTSNLTVSQAPSQTDLTTGLLVQSPEVEETAVVQDAAAGVEVLAVALLESILPHIPDEQQQDDVDAVMSEAATPTYHTAVQEAVMGLDAVATAHADVKPCKTMPPKACPVFHALSLKSFTGFKMAPEVAKQKRAAKAHCVVHVRTQVLRAWKHWMMVEKEVHHKTAGAVHMWTHVLQRKGLATWMSHMHHKQHEQQQLEFAVDHRRQQCMRACLAAWVDVAKYQGPLRRRVTALHNKVVMRTLQGTFDDWRLETQVEAKLRDVKKHFSSLALVKAFNSWRDVVAYRQQRRSLLQTAVLKLRKLLLARAFDCWLEHKEQLQYRRTKAQKVVAVWTHKQLTAAFSGWKHTSTAAIKKRHAVLLALNHWQKLSASRALNTWKELLQAGLSARGATPPAALMLLELLKMPGAFLESPKCDYGLSPEDDYEYGMGHADDQACDRTYEHGLQHASDSDDVWADPNAAHAAAELTVAVAHLNLGDDSLDVIMNGGAAEHDGDDMVDAGGADDDVMESDQLEAQVVSSLVNIHDSVEIPQQQQQQQQQTQQQPTAAVPASSDLQYDITMQQEPTQQQPAAAVRATSQQPYGVVMQQVLTHQQPAAGLPTFPRQPYVNVQQQEPRHHQPAGLPAVFKQPYDGIILQLPKQQQPAAAVPAAAKCDSPPSPAVHSIASKPHGRLTQQSPEQQQQPMPADCTGTPNGSSVQQPDTSSVHHLVVMAALLAAEGQQEAEQSSLLVHAEQYKASSIQLNVLLLLYKPAISKAARGRCQQLLLWLQSGLIIASSCHGIMTLKH
eukprot:jgi/Chrzof1/15060/Cz09g25190.t1